MAKRRCFCQFWRVLGGFRLVGTYFSLLENEFSPAINGLPPPKSGFSPAKNDFPSAIIHFSPPVNGFPPPINDFSGRKKRFPVGRNPSPLRWNASAVRQRRNAMPKNVARHGIASLPHRAAHFRGAAWSPSYPPRRVAWRKFTFVSPAGLVNWLDETGLDHRRERTDWKLSRSGRAALRPGLARAGAHACGF